MHIYGHGGTPITLEGILSDEGALHRLHGCEVQSSFILVLQEVDAAGREAKILVQLKLDDSINNEFEYCEVHVPFPNR